VHYRNNTHSQSTCWKCLGWNLTWYEFQNHWTILFK
jgi:hypothetical protein